MGRVAYNDGYDHDPEVYGNGLPGWLLAQLDMQRQQQEGGAFPRTPNSNASSGFRAEGGLLGRLDSLAAEENQYQPIAGASWPAPSAAPNIGQPLLNMPPQPVPPQSPGQTYQQAQSGHGVGSPNVQETSPFFDPMDTAKSFGIGVANGVVDTVGLPGTVATGFGFLPEHYVENPIRRFLGYPDLPPGEPGWVEAIGPNNIRRQIERFSPKFYEPKSAVGRYAETIGEFAPAIVGGELPGLWKAGRAGIAQASRAMAGRFPKKLLDDAIVPGAIVQALEDALPNSKIGQDIQKSFPIVTTVEKHYPTIRNAMPAVVQGVQYYLRRKGAP